MGSKAAIDIINKAKTITQDIKDVFWPKEEPLEWLNAGQLDIAMNRPDVSSILAEHVCARGPTQTIPANGLRFLDAGHNIDTGYVISPINRSDLDVVQRTWQKFDTDADEVEHYIYDERFPKQFKLYPAPSVGVKIEIGYSIAPTDVVLSTFDGSDRTPISLDDTYANALMYFILAMLFQKQTKVTQASNKVQQYYGLYYQSLGIKFDSDAMFSAANPNNKAD